ncbi:hypothetical protein BX616_002681, partial [Lobosporangium transversale]
MLASVVLPGSIPEFVHPPIPGESHAFYGDTHLESIKLPAPVPIHNSRNLFQSRSGSFVDSLAVNEVLNSSSSSNTSISRNIKNDDVSTFTAPVSAEGSSDDVLWARLVEGCINGQAQLVQEILIQSPQLKDSIDNISSATGMNPLHFAASRGHDEIVRILIDQAGAGLDIQDREGE